MGEGGHTRPRSLVPSPRSHSHPTLAKTTWYYFTTVFLILYDIYCCLKVSPLAYVFDIQIRHSVFCIGHIQCKVVSTYVPFSMLSHIWHRFVFDIGHIGRCMVLTINCSTLSISMFSLSRSSHLSLVVWCSVGESKNDMPTSRMTLLKNVALWGETLLSWVRTLFPPEEGQKRVLCTFLKNDIARKILFYWRRSIFPDEGHSYPEEGHLLSPE